VQIGKVTAGKRAFQISMLDLCFCIGMKDRGIAQTKHNGEPGVFCFRDGAF
jgi:hypothetical protein